MRGTAGLGLVLLGLGCAGLGDGLAPAPEGSGGAAPAEVSAPADPEASPEAEAPAGSLSADAAAVGVRPTPGPSVPAAARRRAGPVVCGLDPEVTGPETPALQRLGREAGLEHPDAFASVALTLARTGALPDCYLTKREAADRGWRRGEPLWEAAPGAAIGGDRFGNRERLLPLVGGSTRHVEADLDDDGGRRGAHRLVFQAPVRSGAPRLWITTDHYHSFVDASEAL